MHLFAIHLSSEKPQGELHVFNLSYRMKQSFLTPKIFNKIQKKTGFSAEKIAKDLMQWMEDDQDWVDREKDFEAFANGYLDFEAQYD